MIDRDKRSLSERLAAFLTKIDRLTNPGEHPEYFATETWDRLIELQSFASRVIRPSGKVLESLENARDLILDESARPEESELKNHFLEIEKSNKLSFRSKKEDDIA